MHERTYHTAVARIADRAVHFDAIACQNRLRIAAAGTDGRLAPLGSVIYLDTDTPGLRVSAPLEVEWTAANCRAIIDEAIRIWQSIQRECTG